MISIQKLADIRRRIAPQRLGKCAGGDTHDNQVGCQVSEVEGCVGQRIQVAVSGGGNELADELGHLLVERADERLDEQGQEGDKAHWRGGRIA